MGKITKLSFALSQPSEKEYEKAKRKYIAEYQERRQGFLLYEYVNRPDVAEAKWASDYPDGWASWVARRGTVLTSSGQQELIDKVNEVVDAFNKLTLPSTSKKATKK